MIQTLKTQIPGVLIIAPKVFNDPRGYFMETFNQRDFNLATGLTVNFVQDNESSSRRGVMRGLHFQRPPFAQSKLLRCVAGAVIDVVVDLRKGSPAFGQHITVELSADNKRQLFVPKGLAHGFAVISPQAVVQYKCDEFYHPDAEDGIFILDPALRISWPFPPDETILSPADRARPLLARFDSPFVYQPD